MNKYSPSKEVVDAIVKDLICEADGYEWTEADWETEIAYGFDDYFDCVREKVVERFEQGHPRTEDEADED